MTKLDFSMSDDEDEVNDAEAGPSSSSNGVSREPLGKDTGDDDEETDPSAIPAGKPSDAAKETFEDVPEDGAHSG